MRKLIWISIGVIVVGAIGIGLSMMDSGVPVETAMVERRNLEVALSEDGKTRYRTKFTLSAPIAGRLSRIEFDVGDSVEPGQVLGRVYPKPQAPREAEQSRAALQAARARYSESRARVEELQARSEQLSRELERTQALRRANVTTEQELENDLAALKTAREQLRAARATVRARDAEIASAKAALSGITTQADEDSVAIVAPVAGRVLEIMQKDERVVPSGHPIIEISDGTSLEAVIDLRTEEAVEVKPGQEVRMEGWGGEHTLRGKVRRIEPMAFTEISTLGVEEERVRVLIDFLDAPAKLGGGYRLEAQIVTWSATDVVVVPTSAIFQREGSWHCFVKNGGNARLREVMIGKQSRDFAEVKEGLDPGESVILYPQQEISDGVSVESNSGGDET